MSSTTTTALVPLSLAAVVRPMYGNNCSVKCVVNEYGDFILVKDANLLLQSLDIEHPLAQLIVSVCTAHSERFGSGVKYLLTLVGLLSQAVMTLRDQGIPPSTTIPAMRDILSDCVHRLPALCIPVSTSPLLHQDEHTMTGQGQISKGQGQDCVVQGQDFQGHFPSSQDLRQDATTTTGSVLGSDEMHTDRFHVEGFLESSCSKRSTNFISETLVERRKEEAPRLVESDDEDDIGWFFEDGVADFKASVNSSGQESVRVASVSDTSWSEVSPPVSSLKDGDHNDDEFDDCFDVPTKHCAKSTTESNTLSRQRFINDSKTSSEEQCIIHTKINDNDDISREDVNKMTVDFNSCFDDLNRLLRGDNLKSLPVDTSSISDSSNNYITDINSHVLTRKMSDVQCDSLHSKPDGMKGHTGQSNLESAISEDMKVSGDDETEMRLNSTHSKRTSELERMDRLLKAVRMKCNSLSDQCLASDSSTSTQSLTDNAKMPLEACKIMLENSKISSKDNSMLNCSRHFKPSKNGIVLGGPDRRTDAVSEDIGGMTSTTDRPPDRDTIEKLLQRKLQENKKQSLSASLSQSRHFKTFQNVTVSNSVPPQDNLPMKISDHVTSTSQVKDLSQYSMSHSKLETDGRVSSEVICEVPFNHPVKHSVCDQPTIVPAQPSHTTVPLYGREHITRHSPVYSTDHSQLAPVVPLEVATLEEAAHGLTHGCCDAMELVLLSACRQMKLMQSTHLNLKLLVTCTVSGPPVSDTAVTPGLVFSCDTDSVSHILAQPGVHKNILLVNGDVSPSFHHRGYKTAVNGSNVIGLDGVMCLSPEDKWIEESLSILKKLSVDVLLVKGHVQEKIKDGFRAHGVETVQNVPFKVLEALRDLTGTEMTVYVQDVKESHVCAALHIEPYLSTWCDNLNQGQTTHVVIDTSTPGPLQTIVLCHPSPQAAQLKEQEVKVCTHRLANALHDGRVLPGGGATETYCSEYLQELYEKLLKSDDHHQFYKSVIIESLAHVFLEMGSMVQIGSSAVDQTSNSLLEHHSTSGSHCTTGTKTEIDRRTSAEHKHSVHKSSYDLTTSVLQSRHPHIECMSDDDGVVYDNFNSKMAAWSAAMDTVAMVIETDAHVVTGVMEDSDTGLFVCGVLL